MTDDLFNMMQEDIANGLGVKPEPIKAPTPAMDVLYDPNDDWMQRANDLLPTLAPNHTTGSPLPHQVLALGEAALKNEHAYWIDAGGGKTYCCIYEASALFNAGKIDAVVVIAPNGPHRQWVTKEFPKWCGLPWHGTYRGAHKTSQHGETYPSNKFFDSGRTDKLAVISLNYEGLPTKDAREWLAFILKKYPRFFLVVDETQKVKGHKSARTALTNMIAERATYRRLLSGTPLLKGLEDLFTQYFILKPGITRPKSGRDIEKDWMICRNWYCKMIKVPGADDPRSQVKSFAKKIGGYRNQEEFRTRVRPYSTRITEDMFGKKTGADFMEYEVTMTGPQKAAYVQMKNNLIADISTGRITAKNALVALAKLRQIASGFIYDEEGNVEWLSSTKIDAAVTLLEGISGDAIVWSPDRAMLDKLEGDLAKSFTDRPIYRYRELEDVDLWQKTGGVMIGNPGSGLGVGMNLQNAANNIYVANSFSSEARWQSLKRTDRLGQTKQVRNWDIIAESSVDRKVLDKLAANAEIAALNVDGLKDIAL